MTLNSQLLSVQILTNDVQVLILGLSYFITTVLYLLEKTNYFSPSHKSYTKWMELKNLFSLKLTGIEWHYLSIFIICFDQDYYLDDYAKLMAT